MELKKYRHIDSFRQVYGDMLKRRQFTGRNEAGEPVYDENLKLSGVIGFQGTVKLHGTNSSVARCGFNIWFQSRNRIITPENDNSGFAAFAGNAPFNDLLNRASEMLLADFSDTVVIYGEFVGKGIQGKTAVSRLPRRYVIFDAVKYWGEDVEYLPPEGVAKLFAHDADIWNIYEFQTYNIKIDLENPGPGLSQANGLTGEVYRQCPAGAYFGEIGPGEGLVWRSTNCPGVAFKTKAKEFEASMINKKPAQVTKEVSEEFKNAVKFADAAVSENRLEQAYGEVVGSDAPEMGHIGPFIKWVIADIAREERDIIAKNNFEQKVLNKLIQERAKKYIMRKINGG